MAHNIRIVPFPHTNKDGSKSATKKDYRVIDRTRGKRVLVGVATTLKGAAKLVEDHREQTVAKHLLQHPNDTAFLRKHEISEGN